MTRDQKLIALFAAISLCAGGVVVARMTLGDVPPVRAVAPPAPRPSATAPGPDSRLSLQFVGDTLLGDAAQRRIDRHGYDWPLAGVRQALTADVTVAVSEGPFTDRDPPRQSRKRYSYTSRPAAAAALARAGVDALSLANDHAFDAGTAGFADTLRHTGAAGIDTFGAGSDLARAAQPLLLRSKVGTVAIVGFEDRPSREADANAPGTAALSTHAVQRGFQLARSAGAQWVIATVHWGDTYAPVTAAQRDWARRFAQAGYNMVVGSGPHRSQPVEFVDTMPVFYSVGNFVFGTPGSWDGADTAGRGLLVDLELSARHAPRLSMRCVVTDNQVVGYQPRLCTPAEARRHLPTLHPGLVVRHDRAALPCRCFTRGGPP